MYYVEKLNHLLRRSDMEEIREKKQNLRIEVAKKLQVMPEEDLIKKSLRLERRLYEFANFQEANIVLLYLDSIHRFLAKRVIEKCLGLKKIVVLPKFGPQPKKMKLLKLDNPEDDLKVGHDGMLELDETHCKSVPIDRVDIAIIPGVVFDEKGGRIGQGDGYYDRLLPKLSITTRKVSLAFEFQIVPQVPMESHDKHVDIIITEERTIYKI